MARFHIGSTLTFLFIIIISTVSLVFSQENLTITTYYPSPYGNYNDLEVANSLRVGPVDTAINAITKINVKNDLAVSVDGQIQAALVADNTGGGVLVRSSLGRIWRLGGLVYTAAVYGSAPTSARNYAGYFQGNVYVSGTLNTCVRRTFTASSGFVPCPSGYTTPLNPYTPHTHTDAGATVLQTSGSYLCCKFQ